RPPDATTTRPTTHPVQRRILTLLPVFRGRYYRKAFPVGMISRNPVPFRMKGKLKKSMSRDPVLRRAAISWARQGELTPQRLWPVLRALGGVEALLASSEEELTKRLESGTRALAVLRSAEDVSSEKWVTQLERAGVRVVTAFDEEYPHSLAEISDPPFLLFATGNLERLRLPAVGIVGSRAATRYGRD